MKKLFISQPMRDKTDEEIKAERARIVKAVVERFGEVEVIDSFFLNLRHMTLNLYGFLASPWNCFQMLITRILQMAGKITGDAGLNTIVQSSTELILLEKVRNNHGI